MLVELLWEWPLRVSGHQAGAKVAHRRLCWKAGQRACRGAGVGAVEARLRLARAGGAGWKLPGTEPGRTERSPRATW